MEFNTRHPDTLFFPTLHIHDGAVHAEEDYDHTLYFQEPLLQDKLVSLPDLPHRDSYGVIRASTRTLPSVARQNVELFMDISRTQGVVALGQQVQRVEVGGRVKNQDILMPLVK